MKYAFLILFLISGHLISAEETMDLLGGKKLRSKPAKLNLIVDESALRIAGHSFDVGVEATYSIGST